MSGTIAFVGLGAMGSPMAKRLVANGHAVRGFDLNPQALDSLKQAGGQTSGSAAAAAEGADTLLVMVVNAAQARAVLFDGKALAALAPKATVVLMATCAPAEALAIGEEVAASGRGFIDAPVSGGVVGAESGTLTIMAAAPKPTFAALEPLLKQMGDKLFHVGERWGQGASVKTINQLLCGVHIAACAEAFALGEKAGLDGKLLLQILGNSAAASWMLNNRGPRMLQSDPQSTSAVDIFVKDLSIVADAGKASRMGLPLAAAALQMFLAASGAGHGKADDSQVIRAYRALNGLA
jgi:3-hydroxyisobutyrate dehydrogenase